MTASIARRPARPAVSIAVAPPRRFAQPIALVWLCAALAFAGTSAAMWQRAVAEQDEGQLLVYPELVDRGQVPTIDFEYHYGPAALAPLVVMERLGLGGLPAERALGLLERAALVAGVVHLARRRGPWAAATAAVSASVLSIGLGPASYAWIGGAAAALWSVHTVGRSLDRGSARGLMVAGVLAGLAVSFRVDLAPAVVVMHVIVLRKVAVQQVFPVLAGSVLGLLPVGVLAGLSGWPRVVRQLVIDPVVTIWPGRHLPVPSGDGRRDLALVAIVGSIGLLLAWGAHSRRRGTWPPIELAYGAFVAIASIEMFQRFDEIHAAFVAVLVVPLAAPAAVALSGRTALALAPVPVRLGLAGALALGATLPGVVGPAPPSAVAVRFGARELPVVAGRAEPLQQMLDTLAEQARVGQSLTVAPRDLRRTVVTDTFIYHLVLPTLRPAGFHLEMNPGSANGLDSRLTDQLASSDWLLLTSAYDDVREDNDSASPGPSGPNDAVAERFCRVAEAPPYLLLRRCRAG